MSKLNVDQKSIKDLLNNKKADFLIPDYQRPYAWGEDQIGRLLGDIKEAFDRQDKMFVGTIQVSAPIKIDDDKYSFNLIDGQQRLSTLLMLLKTLDVGSKNTLWKRQRIFFSNVHS